MWVCVCVSVYERINKCSCVYHHIHLPFEIFLTTAFFRPRLFGTKSGVQSTKVSDSKCSFIVALIGVTGVAGQDDESSCINEVDSQ